MDCLIINSYAGSLTVAATQLKLNVLASIEDHAYGLGTQRLNFPKLTYVPELPWPHPGQSLDECVVIAHPPCAAFSAQNNSANKGVGSTHFDCTTRVLEYSAQYGARAILIESVTGAYEGAREYYDDWAKKNPYDVYRILQNAVTFGVPQWRPRYWTVLVRRDAIKQRSLVLRHKRKYVSLGEALGEGIPGPINEYTNRYWDRQVHGLKAGGLTQRVIDDILENETGHLARIIAKKLDMELHAAKKKFTISSFDSHVFTLLPTDGFAHTVMCVSNWLWQGRPVNVPELNVIAGFPKDYKFDKLRDQKCLLSKGVAPPVAKWLLREVLDNLEGEAEPIARGSENVYVIKPGETADLRVTRAQAKQRELFQGREN